VEEESKLKWAWYALVRRIGLIRFGFREGPSGSYSGQRLLPVNELNELILMRKSRRQFIGGHSSRSAPACTGCRSKNTAPTNPAIQLSREERQRCQVAGQRGWALLRDADCIDCDLCRDIAPTIFARNDKEGHSCVRKQPNSDSELRACLEAWKDVQ